MNKSLVVITTIENVLTDNSYFYSKKDDCFVKFNDDASLAIKIFEKNLPDCDLQLCSSNFKLFDLFAKYGESLNYNVERVADSEKVQWLSTLFPDRKIYYIGGSLYDEPVFHNRNFYSICGSTSSDLLKKYAMYVSSQPNGSNFLDCILHIVAKEISSTKDVVLLNYLNS